MFSFSNFNTISYIPFIYWFWKSMISTFVFIVDANEMLGNVIMQAVSGNIWAMRMNMSMI